MGVGNVGAAKPSLKYVVVVVNVVLALEAVLALIIKVVAATLRSGGIALAIFVPFVPKGSALDLEALPATNIAAGGAFCILVARVRRQSARRRVTRLQ